jgi:hypothetical protein
MSCHRKDRPAVHETGSRLGVITTGAVEPVSV